MINIIAAISENNVIGKDNQLLWKLPKDMKHFRELTTGHPVIMGRKTFESIGRPLPNRANIIITRNPNYPAPEGCKLANSLSEAISMAKQIDEEVFIIGGGEIYKTAMIMAERIYLTIVHKEFEGDAFFPQITAAEWPHFSSDYQPADEKNELNMTFMTLSK